MSVRSFHFLACWCPVFLYRLFLSSFWSFLMMLVFNVSDHICPIVSPHYRAINLSCNKMRWAITMAEQFSWHNYLQYSVIWPLSCRMFRLLLSSCNALNGWGGWISSMHLSYCGLQGWKACRIKYIQGHPHTRQQGRRKDTQRQTRIQTNLRWLGGVLHSSLGVDQHPTRLGRCLCFDTATTIVCTRFVTDVKTI